MKIAFPKSDLILLRSSQYASIDIRSITVAADLKQLEAVKVGPRPPGSNFDILPVYVPFGLLCFQNTNIGPLH